MLRDSELRSLTHRVIPGGAHTYSKGDDQFPSNAPRYIEKGEGCYVWGDDNKRYLDWTMGLRSVSLGYGIEEVNDAVIKQIYKGANFCRPSYLETELALKILELIPNGQMVKFAKNGSSVTTAATKLARAYTGRDYIALCKNHPFFSYDDWFIGTTLSNRGVPKSISDLSQTFNYNDIASLEKLFLDYPNKIAAVILEPATTEHPSNNFLSEVRNLCEKNGAVLIFDEMITGFRWHLNGAQTYYDVIPDLSTFGKGIANGFSLAALVGKREIMELGDIFHSQKRVFLLSTTHGAENHSLAAALATLNFFKEKEVVSHMWKMGGRLIEGINQVVKEFGLEKYFSIGGIDCSPYYVCKDKNGNNSFEFRTLFLQEMVKEGILINYIAPSYSHSQDTIDFTVSAVRKALKVYKMALDKGVKHYLLGPAIKPVFREYN